MRRKRGRQRLRQQLFGFLRRGGKRKGAGRKPQGRKAGVSHDTREKVDRHSPVLVTVKLRDCLCNLRKVGEMCVLRRALRTGANRSGFCLIEFSVQFDHLHLIAEAKNKDALAKGMQGLSVRVARALNKLWGRRGRVLADRYHSRALKSPTEVRRALLYTLNNGRHHGAHFTPNVPDPCSSGATFKGWLEEEHLGPISAAVTGPLVKARSWLLREGWKRDGLLPISAISG